MYATSTLLSLLFTSFFLLPVFAVAFFPFVHWIQHPCRRWSFLCLFADLVCRKTQFAWVFISDWEPACETSESFIILFLNEINDDDDDDEVTCQTLFLMSTVCLLLLILVDSSMLLVKVYQFSHCVWFLCCGYAMLAERYISSTSSVNQWR